MAFRKLKWHNSVTPSGKKDGLFGLVADNETLNLWYEISNDDPKDPKRFTNKQKWSDKFIIIIGNKTHYCKTLQEAKSLAQADFQKWVTKLFFKK